MDETSLWKQISGWLWAVLAVPLAALWKKADGAASKDDLKDSLASLAESVKNSADASDRASEKLRESVIELYRNAETDRRRCDDRFREAQTTIHGIHTEVLRELRNK